MYNLPTTPLTLLLKLRRFRLRKTFQLFSELPVFWKTPLRFRLCKRHPCLVLDRTPILRACAQQSQPCPGPSARRPVLYLLSQEAQLKVQMGYFKKAVLAEHVWCSLRFSPTISIALLRPKIRKQALQSTLSKMLLGEVVLNRNRLS